MAKKHLVVEWLSWLSHKSGFINSNILETSKDRPNIPPSLKLLEQSVHELVGGRGWGPLTTLWESKISDQEGLILMDVINTLCNPY